MLVRCAMDGMRHSHAQPLRNSEKPIGGRACDGARSMVRREACSKFRNNGLWMQGTEAVDRTEAV